MRMNGQVKNQRVFLRCQSVDQWQPNEMQKKKKKEKQTRQHIKFFIKLYSSITVQLKHYLCEVFPHLLWKYSSACLSIIPYGITYSITTQNTHTLDRWTNTVSTHIHTEIMTEADRIFCLEDCFLSLPWIGTTSCLCPSISPSVLLMFVKCLDEHN